MPLLLAFLVFIAVVALVSLAGMKMYVRPKEAMERVAGGIDPADHVPTHPSLAIHELIKRLGNFIPRCRGVPCRGADARLYPPGPGDRVCR